METVREFIKEAVGEYNSGKLMPKKLRDMLTAYEEVFERVHKTNCYNIRRAFITVYIMFRGQGGKKVKKVDFEWTEEKGQKALNPFYESLD